jgi:hypothetical protein
MVRGLARSHNDLSATLHLLRCKACGRRSAGTAPDDGTPRPVLSTSGVPWWAAGSPGRIAQSAAREA